MLRTTHAGSGQEIIAKGFVLLLAGVPIYIGMKWWQQRDAGRTAVGPGLPPVSVDHMAPPDSADARPHRGRQRERTGMTPDSPVLETPAAARMARPEPRLFVGSEVGVLRRVLLHRPDLELKRLTPRNKDELLFDDVLWVKRARQEHDAFADALAERGVEVLYLDDLLAGVLADRTVREEVLNGTMAAAGLGPRLA